MNAAFYETLFLDGRANSLEEQALGPFINPIEHGLKNHQAIVEVIHNDSNYRQQFNNVFTIQANEIAIDHVVKAIASYERTLISGNSLFDRYLFGRDHSVLSDSAERGSRDFPTERSLCHLSRNILEQCLIYRQPFL